MIIKNVLDFEGLSCFTEKMKSFVTAITSKLETNKLDKTTVATSSTLGLVKSGTDITVDTSGNVSVNDNSHKHTVSNISDLTATTTELNYVDGVTSNIQTQLNAKAPLASPTLTGTPKAPTATAGTNSTQIATTAFVTTAVANGIAASDAMIIKGTIGTSGTVTSLPTTYKTGWTYRVVTAGTYAGQVCEIGDLIVALVDRSGSGNLDSDWCVAQTNINGAITGIKSGDAYITTSQSGSVVTITHKDVTRTNTTSTASPTHGGTFTAVKTVTSDAKGHVTGVDTETVTLPTYTALKNPNAISINGKSYDGSSAVNVGTIGAAYGGTGKTSLNDSANVLINSLSTGDDTPSDADYYVAQYAGGGTTNTTYHRRPISALWNYIKSKLATVATSGSYNDLSNKPTIGNGTVTIKQAGTSKGTFTMNQSGNTTIELTDNNTTYSAATTSASGLMTAAMVTKLNGIATGAEVNQNAFSNVVVGTTTISADSKTDSLTLAGSNVTLTPDATNDKVTIGITKANVTTALGYTPPTTNTTYGVATSSALGLVKSGTDITVDSSGNVSVNDDSHNHVISNVDGLQTALDGKAATSHGTHVSYSTTAPLVAGTASVGTASTVSRSDHVHPAQTTVSGNAGSATKLATARTIDGVSFNGESAIIHYGTCSTAAGTAAKTVSCTGFTLVTGATIRVKFTVTNTASSPTLNVNSTGAKSIMYRGSAISAGYLAANRVYEFVYDGTDYELVGDINVDTNTDTKVNTTLATTTKAYLLGTSTTPTSTAQAVTTVSDTGVYLDTTAGQLVATKFKGALVGNADTATKATKDVNGNIIVDTYARKSSVLSTVAECTASTTPTDIAGASALAELSSEIGKLNYIYFINGTNKSIPTGTKTSVGSFTLNPGTYIIDAYVRWACNSNGYRAININSQKSPTYNLGAYPESNTMSASGISDNLTQHMIMAFNVTNAVTLHVVVYQNSGSAINIDAAAVRITKLQ